MDFLHDEGDHSQDFEFDIDLDDSISEPVVDAISDQDLKRSLSNPDDLEVKTCDVGKGVFASRDFSAREIVGLVTGKIVDDPNHCSEYCIELDDTYSLEPFEPFRFLNHSCEPNAELSSFEDGTFADIFVIAIRDIHQGEEILIDYAWPAESAAPCFCQSLNCRGWIVAENEVQKVDRGE